jgi:beta-lactamase regulating signal transducer with metallopeptidase domain
MVHVEEKHSVDKLFMQLVLIFCWCNPFFWLIRKELHAIHEFIADQKSVDQQDTAAFASMILQAAYPKHYPALVNPFFQTSIKRRIIMLTKLQNPPLPTLTVWWPCH